MARPARVKSIDVLQTFSAALDCFRAETTTALDDLDMEIRRALEWIGQDCRQFWTHELRRSRDGLTEARIQLQRAMTYRRMAGEQSSCLEEKKAVTRAQRRVETAETKLAAIPHWIVTIERAINEYRAQRSQFANWLESDYPRAVASLGRMSSALETYVQLATHVDDHAPIAKPAEEQKEQPASAEEIKPPQSQANDTES